MQKYISDDLTLARNYQVEASLDLPLDVLWRYKAGPIDCGIGLPLSTPGEVYFLESHIGPDAPYDPARFYALNPTSGKKLWHFDILQQIGWLSRNCIVDDMIITSDHRDLIGIRNGEKCWRAEGFGDRTDSILYHQNLLILSRHDGVYFIDSETGSLVSKFEVDRPSPVAVRDSNIFFGQLAGSCLHCIAPKAGGPKIVWQVDLAKIGEYYSVTDSRVKKKNVYKPGKLSNRFPVLFEDNLYACIGQEMACFEPATGRLKWKSPGYGDPVVKEGRLYAWATYEFICLDAATGENIYTNKHVAAAGFVASVPILVDRYFFIGTKNLCAFDIETGKIAWEFKSKRRNAHFGDPGYIDGRLYSGCQDGYCYCFG